MDECMEERLTERNSSGEVYIPLRSSEGHWELSREHGETRVFGDAADKLSEYEDAAEDGRLVIFPAAVGNSVYFIYEDKVDSENINGFVVSSPRTIIEIGTLGFWTGGTGKYLENADFTPWGELGKTAFLDKAEAEKKIKELATDYDNETEQNGLKSYKKGIQNHEKTSLQK